MAYFQGGDFVELLSAQGKAPAAAWKLQGKISKTFDKGIRGNAFQLDGGSETKMQLPKTASSSLGLAQRFVVIQLLVPFTRSFSVEICFSDFQKWMNLVFDLQTLSEVHFPDTGYRSMESVCIGGSCRLKRIFTMKDAPTPSRGSQVVRHADIRDIPRQFVFSATQRGASETTQDGDSDIVAGGGGNALSIDLTSELSASAEGSVHDLGEVGDCKSSNAVNHRNMMMAMTRASTSRISWKMLHRATVAMKMKNHPTTLPSPF
ncbi:Transcription factor IIB [Phytophthora cinnamomi]|uniref:Transcription factor IIB n=1 Tax=Phytophthora cinnamomi TaxID=4785 RepID=UPI00355946F8|nr:Transcription factor IIB [Phytophthora cinnamomi]KAG6623643.1 Transcription factor IIB [Phytophthora cinnamomi]